MVSKCSCFKIALFAPYNKFSNCKYISSKVFSTGCLLSMCDFLFGRLLGCINLFLRDWQTCHFFLELLPTIFFISSFAWEYFEQPERRRGEQLLMSWNPTSVCWFFFFFFWKMSLVLKNFEKLPFLKKSMQWLPKSAIRSLYYFSKIKRFVHFKPSFFDHNRGDPGMWWFVFRIQEIV